MEYVHSQSSASAQWVIYHNLNTKNIVIDVTVNTVSGVQKILPKEIISVDVNSAIVSFSQAMAGQARIVTSGGGSSIEIPVFSTTYNMWNPSDIYTFTSLSNANKTMSTNQTSWTGGRALHFRDYGSFYWEMTTGGNVNGSFWMGLADADWDKIQLGSATGINMGVRPAALYSSAYGYNNAILNGSVPSMDLTGVFMFAVDLGPGKLWIGRNGVWFNGNPGTGNNPLFNYTPSVLMTPAAAVYNSNSSVTLVTEPSSLTYAPPTGFSEWII